jgi:hypothetical protein
MATNITDPELQKLLSEGLSQTEIVRRTGIARSTLRRRLEKLGTPKVDTGVQNEGTPNVYDSTQLSKPGTETVAELQELLTWWRERKLTVQIKDDPEQETERKTYHVQKRYIEAIQRAADLEHVSIMEIVNRAFAHYFNREHD